MYVCIYFYILFCVFCAEPPGAGAGSTPRRQPIKGLYSWYFKNVLPRIGQALARNPSSAYNYLPDSVGEFPAYEQLVEKMLNAGLSQARFIPLTFGIATLYVGVK